MNTRPTNRRENEKKEYQAPVLITYGTVWELTQKVGRNGNSDGRLRGLRIKTHA